MTSSGNCTSSSEFFYGQAETPLLALSDAVFLQTVLPPKQERSVFAVALEEYPMQPWMRYKAHDDFSQWFNYALTAKTFKDYAAEQLRIEGELRKRYATAVAGHRQAEEERAGT